jgi:predicted transcriptional regulator
MSEGLQVLAREGFVSGRVTKSTKPRPRPKYYEMADGTNLPASIGPDDLKKAIAAGLVREVSAPPAVVPPPVTTSSTVLPREDASKESYEDTRNARRRQAQEDYEAQLAELSRVRNEALAKIEAEEKAQEAAQTVAKESEFSAAEILEDLVWALGQEGSHLQDGNGHVISGMRIVRNT